MLRVGGFFSGSGTTMGRIIKECDNGILEDLAVPVVAIASRQCDGIQRCIEAGMLPKDVLILRKGDYASPEAHARALLRELQARKVDFIGLYGYTSLVHPIVIGAFPGMMVNQHPGPLDPPREDFGGRYMVGRVVHECVLGFAKTVEWQFHETEATAHRVTDEYDKGAVVGRRPLTLRTDHTPESLANKLLLIEHELQVGVIGQFAQGRAQELPRPEPLIPSEWVPILQRVKKMVIAQHHP